MLRQTVQLAANAIRGAGVAAAEGAQQQVRRMGASVNPDGSVTSSRTGA